MMTLSSLPHSDLCAHGWPRRLPVWRRKWLDCCRSWLVTPEATCRVRAQSGASLTGWPRCLSVWREGPGRAKKLWGKNDRTYQRESVNHNSLFHQCCSSFYFSLTSSFYSLGISSHLCATSQLRKVPGRCCSPSTHRPCWWTFCHRAGLPSRGKVEWHQPGIQAWRPPAQPSSISLLQSQKESGSWFTGGLLTWNLSKTTKHQMCFI